MKKLEWLHRRISKDSYGYPGHIVHAIVEDLQKLYAQNEMAKVPLPNERIYELEDPTPLVEKLNNWKQLGKAARTIIAEVYRTGDAKSVYGVNYHEWLSSYENLEGGKSVQKCTIKGTENHILDSIRYFTHSVKSKGVLSRSQRLAKLEEQMAAIAERMESAELRISGVDNTVAKFIGSTNRILNDLRKDVNEVLAEKNSNMQRIEKLEDLLNRQTSRIDAQHRLILNILERLDNPDKKANLEEIITKLRTL